MPLVTLPATRRCFTVGPRAPRRVYRRVSFLARKLRRSAPAVSLSLSPSVFLSLFAHSLPANISAALPAARSPRTLLDPSFPPPAFSSILSPLISRENRRRSRGDALTRPRCRGWQERRPRTTAERRHGVTASRWQITRRKSKEEGPSMKEKIERGAVCVRAYVYVQRAGTIDRPGEGEERGGEMQRETTNRRVEVADAIRRQCWRIAASSSGHNEPIRLYFYFRHASYRAIPSLEPRRLPRRRCAPCIHVCIYTHTRARARVQRARDRRGTRRAARHGVA